jgi:cholera toxin transcriptional activator
LLAGYAVNLLLCVFTFYRFSFSFDTPTIETASTQQNEITLHALGNNGAEAQSLRDISAEHAKKLPPHLKGQVWINYTKTNYSVSCIRPDMSTANLESNSHQNDLAMMIQRCLEATL